MFLIGTKFRKLHLTFAICGVSRTKWTHLLVQRGAWQRAQLTVGTPATAAITAALRLGDAVAIAGSHLAKSLEDLRKAEALSVVCTQYIHIIHIYTVCTVYTYIFYS